MHFSLDPASEALGFVIDHDTGVVTVPTDKPVAATLHIKYHDQCIRIDFTVKHKRKRKGKKK